MLIVFQILAVLAIVAAALFMLRDGGARHQAVRRISMMVFIVAAASSVFLPQIWTKLANLFGVARGADLLLYLLVLTFLGFVASTYRRFRALEGHVTELARRMAIDHAERPDDRSGPAKPDLPTDESGAIHAPSPGAPGAASPVPEAPGAEAPPSEAPPSDAPEGPPAEH